MINNANSIEKNKPFYYKIDWPLLLFIIGAVNVKTYIKVAAILFCFSYFILRKAKFPNTSTGVVKFYLIIPVIGIIASVINHSFSIQGYLFGYLFGMLQWLICATIFYFIYTAVKNTERKKIVNTVDAFFVINILITAFQLFYVMVASHSLMPYWIYDVAEKYGISTGDRLYGLFGNISITNAAISILGGIYFLFNQKIIKAIFCFLIMLLCTSNLSLFFSFFSLILIFIFSKEKIIKKQSFLIIGTLLVLYPIISPGNLRYIRTIYDTFVLRVPTRYENPDSSKIIGISAPNEKYDDSLKRIGIEVPHIEIAYKLRLHSTDPSIYIPQLKELKTLNERYKAHNTNVVLDPNVLKYFFSVLYNLPVSQTPLSIYNKPGKIYSMKQTAYFLTSDYKNFLFGAGMGNFSSKLAIKMTGLELQGKYPQKYVYASPDFLQYHLYELFYYLCQNIALHSVLNMPNSVYNQITGEYGLLGIIAFVVLYIGYFWKNSRRAGYGRFLLITLLFFFNVDYWFEMASLTVIFELLMLMDIFAYQNNDADKPTADNSADAGL